MHYKRAHGERGYGDSEREKACNVWNVDDSVVGRCSYRDLVGSCWEENQGGRHKLEVEMWFGYQ
jgi:hypothetical protein